VTGAGIKQAVIRRVEQPSPHEGLSPRLLPPRLQSILAWARKQFETD
jgi:hypothetical protein